MENKSEIKKININQLYGDTNISIAFNNNVMVLVGENGLGKTTLLNIIYYSLSCDFKKLSRIKFKSIEIFFDNNESVVINRKDIIPKRVSIDTESYTEEEFNKIDLIYETENIRIKKYILDEKIENHYDAIVEKYKNKIERYLVGKILYFPTYRRIEEDLSKIRTISRHTEKKFIEEERNIIQFGMNDVKETFNRILEDIKSSSLNGYTQVTGKMITQLVDVDAEQNISQEAKRNILDGQTIDIILSRIDDGNLSKEYKEKIRSLIASKEIFTAKLYKPLIHLLSDLIRVYNQQQRKQDQAIKRFVSVCNSYLVNKYFQYDESALTLDVYNKNNKKVDLSKLSSGEKQIVSIFSKLFLSVEDNFILLFDEPELSLSIEWQEKLLVDIVHSGKCNFLLAVTHSPFIYNNEFKKNARGIELFIEEYENYERD